GVAGGVHEGADDGRDHALFHRHGLLAVTSHARDPSGRPPGARYGPGAAGTASLARATVGGPTPRSRKLPIPVGLKNATAPAAWARIHSGSATGAARGRDAPRARRRRPP